MNIRFKSTLYIHISLSVFVCVCVCVRAPGVCAGEGASAGQCRVQGAAGPA